MNTFSYLNIGCFLDILTVIILCICWRLSVSWNWLICSDDSQACALPGFCYICYCTSALLGKKLCRMASLFSLPAKYDTSYSCRLGPATKTQPPGDTERWRTASQSRKFTLHRASRKHTPCDLPVVRWCKTSYRASTAVCWCQSRLACGVAARSVSTWWRCLAARRSYLQLQGVLSNMLHHSSIISIQYYAAVIV